MTVEDLSVDEIPSLHHEAIVGLFTPETANTPFPAYRQVREQCPVARVDGFDGTPTVYLSRYEDVMWAMRHPEFFSSAPEAVNIGQDQPLIPLQVDPPDHAQYRRAARPRVLAEEDGCARRRRARASSTASSTGSSTAGSCDFHEEFATPLPSSIFLALMGLPQADLPMFLRWRDDTIRPDAADLDEAAADPRPRRHGDHRVLQDRARRSGGRTPTTH